MKKPFSRVLVISLVGTLAIGCATTREEAGALTGMAAGAAIGSAVGGGRGNALAIWLGAVVGANIGSTIGRYMDEQDRIRMSGIMETQRTNVASSWVNPDTQYRYEVTPTRTYTAPEGPCREFTIDAKIGGKTEEVYGTACRQADGSWKVIK